MMDFFLKKDNGGSCPFSIHFLIGPMCNCLIVFFSPYTFLFLSTHMCISHRSRSSTHLDAEAAKCGEDVAGWLVVELVGACCPRCSDRSHPPQTARRCSA